ncbi:MAG TPA: riboflavin synthase [Salinimicrobium sp.]|nr:riboflavin synthase [Salinimicrobium sp.]
MFTGIIEELGQITGLEEDGGNLKISVKAKMTPELKIDQSVSHNGVCLTVVEINGETFSVTAIEETLKKSILGGLQVGEKINLERAMRLGARLDGHLVQGHVDQTGTCIKIEQKDGSSHFSFSYDPGPENITIEKGSITVNGVSLTVVNSYQNEFSVAIIPYTIENTTFKFLKEGQQVNLEFDVIGKYVKRLTALREN